MVNFIWGCFIIFGVVFGLLSGKSELINKTIIDSSKTGLNMILSIFPVIALWMGLMNIASKSGLLNGISKLMHPVLKYIFPEIPREHEANGLISSNIVANLCGLGNAGTPIALKTMKSLQKLNKKKDTASNSMITFLIINTCGITIIPTTIISLRIMHKSSNPTIIITACFISSLIATVSGLILNRIIIRRK